MKPSTLQSRAMGMKEKYAHNLCDAFDLPEEDCKDDSEKWESHTKEGLKQ